MYPHSPRMAASALVAVSLPLVLAACSGGGKAGSGAEGIDTPDGYDRVNADGVSYAKPADWVAGEKVAPGWQVHLGAHEAHSDVAAAEASHYTDVPKGATPKEAASLIQSEFPSAESITITAADPVDIPGAEGAYRIDYRHVFLRPEFDTYNVADFGIRTGNGTVVAIRLGSVDELVEDGTFDRMVDSLQVLDG